MDVKRWNGMEDCVNYVGVQKISIQKCCGGMVRENVTIGCKVHKRTYARNCRRGVCGYYEKRR